MSDPNDPVAQLQQMEADDTNTAQRIVGENAVTKEQDGYQATINQQRDSQPGIFARAGAAVMKFESDGIQHPIDTLEHGWNGLMSAAQEMVIFADQGLSKIPGWEDVGSYSTHEAFSQYMRSNGNVFGASKFNTDPDNSAGNLVGGVSQFVAGKAAIAAATGGAGIVANTISNVGSMVSAFNPDDPHLGDLLARFPSLKPIVPDFLQSKPGDTEAEGRARASLDGLGFEAVSVVADGFMSWLKGARSAGAIADDAKASAAVKSTSVTTSAPEAATEVSDATAPAVKPEATPAATPTASAAEKPWTPDSVANADTAHPTSSAAESGTESTPVFSPQAVAKEAFSVTPEQSKSVLDAISEGRFNDVPNMLDQTHATIPWDKLSDGANMKGLFNAVEDNIGGMIKDAHGVGTVSADSIRQLAADIGGDRTALSRLYSDTTATGGLAARITAGYNIMVASARQLKTLASAAHSLDAATPEGAQALADFEKQLNLHAAIVGEVRQSSAEIGRALYAHRTLKASTNVTLQQLKEYAGTTQGPKALKDLADTITNGSLADITAVTDKVRGGGFINVLREVAQNGMLSAPTTQIANIASNIGNIALKTAERYISGGIGEIRGVLMPDAEHASMREAVAHTYGVMEGLRNAFSMACAAARDENYSNMFSQSVPKAFTSENPLFRATPGTTYASVIDATGKVIRWPGRFMGLFDHFSQAVGYYGDMSARSYVQAATEADAQGLRSAERDAFMDQRQAEIKAKPTEELKDKAMEAGKYTAFLEDSKVATNVTKLLTDAHPLVKLVVAPFIHRPWNFLRQGLGDYTLLGGLNKDIRSQVLAGGTDSDLAVARMAIGTGAIMASYELADSGLIRGSGKGSKNTQALDQVPMNSVNIGGTWQKFGRLDPVGLWLGLGADIHEAIQTFYDPENPDTTDKLSKVISAAVQSVGNVAMDKSFMKSVDMLMQVVGERHDPARALTDSARLVSENLTKLLPFSGASRAIAHGTDDEARQTSSGSLLDGLKASIPYIASELPPKLDLLGRPIKAQSAFNPFGSDPASKDPLDRELSQLAVQVNVPSRQIDGHALSGQQWDELVSMATKQTMFGGGRNLEAFLRDQIDSDQWKYNQGAQDHGQMLNGMLVQKAIDTAYTVARQQFIAKYPAFDQLKQQEKLEKFQAATTQRAPKLNLSQEAGSVPQPQAAAQ